MHLITALWASITGHQTFANHTDYNTQNARVTTSANGALAQGLTNDRLSKSHLLQPVELLPPSSIRDREKAQVLVDFYNALPFPEKPQLDGDSVIEQAINIRNWMRGEGKPWVSNCDGLDLENKGLKALPPEIGLFRGMLYLKLSKNQLQTLPPEIGQLTKMYWLVLNDNKLETLPAEIGQLQALTLLGLVNNPLRTLPAEIAQLRAEIAR